MFQIFDSFPISFLLFIIICILLFYLLSWIILNQVQISSNTCSQFSQSLECLRKMCWLQKSALVLQKISDAMLNPNFDSGRRGSTLNPEMGELRRTSTLNPETGELRRTSTLEGKKLSTLSQAGPTPGRKSIHVRKPSVALHSMDECLPGSNNSNIKNRRESFRYSRTE